MSSAVFERYRSLLIGQPLSAVWRGHGSALFLEFGALSAHVRRDGTPGQAQGEITAMIEWSWRIEGQDAILCGSWSEGALQDAVFASLIGHTVQDVALEGRLPEVAITLAGGPRIASFMTAEGQPAWTLFDHSDPQRPARWIAVRDGRLQEDVADDGARMGPDHAPPAG